MIILKIKPKVEYNNLNNKKFKKTNKKNIKSIIFILTFIILNIMNIIFSKSYSVEVQNINNIEDNDTYDEIIYLNTNELEINDNLTVYLDLNNTNIKSLTLNIYFDNNKLTYLNNEDNSNVNYLNNIVIYTFTDINYDKNNITEEILNKFEFIAIKEGSANIVVTGSYYDEIGNEILINNYITTININENNKIDENEEKNQIVNEYINGNVVDDVLENDSSLKIMRLNIEGIAPNFNKDVFNYYLVTNNTITNLNLEVYASNSNAEVIIEGNSNFVYGLNIITITVISDDKTSTSVYKINLTKTTDLNVSNADLENLAIANSYNFNPDFLVDELLYYTTISNDTTNLEILAIAKNPNAIVNIIMPDEIIIGDNTITIEVIAEDEITKKVYEIIVHRQSINEELIEKQNQELNAEKLSTLISNQDNEIEENTNNILNTTQLDDNIIEDNAILEFLDIDLDDIIVYILISIILLIILMYKNNKYKKFQK